MRMSLDRPIVPPPRPPGALPIVGRRPPLPSVVLLVALLIGAIPGAIAGGRADAAPPAQATTQVIVSLDRGADPEPLLDQLGITPRSVYRHALNGFAADLPVAAVDALRRNPRVEAVAPDIEVRAFAQPLPTGVDRIDAGGNPRADIDGRGRPVDADVAVLDSGIARYPDLNVVGGKACIGGDTFDDGNGHGTHAAGTIGTEDNGQGVVGVAPGVRLWAVKELRDNGRGTGSSIICGLDWVVANGRIDVVNMSLGGIGTDGPCRSDPFHQAICEVVDRGIPVIVAAGNDGLDAAATVPATWAETIAVSAFADFDGEPGGSARSTCRLDVDDTFADFSTFGNDVDLAAPGVCIRSTWHGGGYRTISGTSMATPHVAGAAALYKADHPNASAGAVRSWLLREASVGQASRDGFSEDRDLDREPVLYLGPDRR